MKSPIRYPFSSSGFAHNRSYRQSRRFNSTVCKDRPMQSRCRAAVLITVQELRKVNIPFGVLPEKFQVTNCNGNPESHGFSETLNRLIAVALHQRFSNKDRSSMALLVNDIVTDIHMLLLLDHR